MENLHEKELWQIAKRRAGFKKSLVAYVLVNTFLWCIYILNGRDSGYPWPIWPMLGWGLGLAIQYIGAYHGQDWFSEKKEFDKLRDSSAKPGNQ